MSVLFHVVFVDHALVIFSEKNYILNDEVAILVSSWCPKKSIYFSLSLYFKKYKVEFIQSPLNLERKRSNLNFND